LSRRPLLGCYLPIADPALPADLASIYADCGVDIFEVGIPSNDPWMDGPSVARSMHRTLAAGVDRACIGKTLADFNKRFAHQALVIMGYADMQLEQVLREHRPVFDGLLCVGADAGECIASAAAVLDIREVWPIPFISFAMPEKEIEAARMASGGYVMLQAAAGKTGTRSALDKTLGDKIQALKQAGLALPILPGFGISSAEQAAAVIQAGADGVIIGSACLQQAEQGAGALSRFLSGVRAAMDGC